MSSQRYEGWNEAIFTIPVTRLREGLPISVEQHLVMRALWPDVLSPPALLANLSAFGLDKVWEEATHLVNSSQDFERYFALIKDASPINTIDENDARWAGSMMPILKLQRSCGGKFFAFLLQGTLFVDKSFMLTGPVKWKNAPRPVVKGSRRSSGSLHTWRYSLGV